MVVLLQEARVYDLSDASTAINSVFLDRPIDLDGKYYLSDVSMFKSIDVIYSVFVSQSLVGLLYSDHNKVGNLFSLPDFFHFDPINESRSDLHYLKFNNLFLGGSILFKNDSFSGLNEAVMTNVYSNLYVEFGNAMTNLTVDNYSSAYPKDSYMKRYDDLTVEFLLPGEINSSVVSYIIKQTEPYFNDYSDYLNEVAITLYFFNPISEIYLQAVFTFQKTIQGTLSFDHTVRGGFPLLYHSHQTSSSTLNFYFGIKMTFFTWTLCLFIYQFSTVQIITFFYSKKYIF